MQRWEPRPSGAAAVAAASLTRNTSVTRIGWKWDDRAVSAGGVGGVGSGRILHSLFRNHLLSFRPEPPNRAKD